MRLVRNGSGPLLALLLSAVAFAQAPDVPTPAAPRRPTRTIIVPSLEKPASARSLTEQDMGGYLMVYFKDQTHSAYFAISRDGTTLAASTRA